MSVGAPSAPPAPAPFVAARCECGRPVVEVRDPAGQLVRLAAGRDGRALRDVEGDWVAAKVDGQWRVTAAELGVPAGATRFLGHPCVLRAAFVAPPAADVAKPAKPVGVTAARTALGRVLGAQPVPPRARARPAPVLPPPDLAGTGDHPVGTQVGVRGSRRPNGLLDPVCEQRAGLRQGPLVGCGWWRMCVRCGRITVRVDPADGLPWCGGTQPPG